MSGVDPYWVHDGPEGCQETEARLDRIAALHHRSAEVTRGSDDQAIYECEECGQDWPCETAVILGDVAPGVVPPQTIDRDAMLDAIRECAPAGMELRYDGTEDKEAAAYVEGVRGARDAAEKALVRPVEGVILTPGEARLAALWFHYLDGKGFPLAPVERALASRLEDAQ